VDVSKPYAEASYFEIEQAMLLGRPHTTCGGSRSTTTSMDTLLPLLVNAANGPRIRDGVDQATVRASQTFPYLAGRTLTLRHCPSKPLGDKEPRLRISWTTRGRRMS